jgi:hypothetical protein
MIEFHDPRAEPGATLEPYQLTAELTEGSTLGLLANGFPDSERFLDQLEASLACALPWLEVKRYNKGNASVIASDQVLAGISKECKAVVTAYGH